MDLENEKNLIESDLARILNSEIKSKDQYLDKTIPADFAFRMIEKDDPNWSDLDRAFGCCNSKISLQSEFDGEEISVFPEMPSGKAKGDSWQFILLVQISKLLGGMKLFLTASASADDITILSVKVKMPKVKMPSDADRVFCSSPPAYILDKEGNMQCALREYLKTRGITETSNCFLYNYMVWKSQTKMLAMENLHKFIKD